MKKADIKQNINVTCEDCVMPMASQNPEPKEPILLKCVRCPFCKQTVTAKLSETKITCLSCNASANRS